MTDNNHVPDLIARTQNDEDIDDNTDDEDDEDDSNYNTDDNSEYDEAAEEADGVEFDEQGKHAAGARVEQGKPGRAHAVANRSQAAANRAQATADRVGSTDRAHHAATEQSPVHKHNLRGRRARDFGHLNTVGYLNNVNRLKTAGTINRTNSPKGIEILETYALCINALL